MDIEQMAFERLRLGAETSKRMYNAPLLLCYSGGAAARIVTYCCSWQLIVILILKFYIIIPQ